MDRHELLNTITDLYAVLADLHQYAVHVGCDVAVEQIAALYSYARLLDDTLVPARAEAMQAPDNVVHLSDYRDALA